MDFKYSQSSSCTVCLIISIWVLLLTTIHGLVLDSQKNPGTQASQKPSLTKGPPRIPELISTKISFSFNCDELRTIKLALKYLNCITCLHFHVVSGGKHNKIINIQRYQANQNTSAPSGYSAYLDNITIHSVVREIVLGLNVNNSHSDADNSTLSPSDADENFTLSPSDADENSTLSPTDADENSTPSLFLSSFNSTDEESVSPDQYQISATSFAHENRFNTDEYASLAEQTLKYGNGMLTIDKLSSSDINSFNKGYCEIEGEIDQPEDCQMVFANVNRTFGAEIAYADEWYQRNTNEDCEPCNSSVPCNCDDPRFRSVEDCRNASGIQLYTDPIYQCVFGECQLCDEVVGVVEREVCQIEHTGSYFEEKQCSENCKRYQCSSISSEECVLYTSRNYTDGPLPTPFYTFDQCKYASAECGYPETYQCIDGNCQACGAMEGDVPCDNYATGYNGLDNCIAESKCES